MTSSKIRLSVNKFLIDKDKPKDTSYFSKGFDNAEMTLEELRDHINQGFAISYQYRGGHRKAENFLATDFLAVDIDHGLKLDQARANPIVQKYCSLLYVTPSHTLDDHRFRLIFRLPRTITDAKEIRSSTRALSRKLGGDMSATDPARLFYGSSGSYPTIFDGSITEEFLNELIEDGKTEQNTESIAHAGSTANRSVFQPEPTMLVKTNNNEFVEVQSIKKTTSIYCHSHNDQNASAFVARSGNGSIFIHCSACQMTWWVKGARPYDRTFEDFDQQIRNIKAGHINIPESKSPLDEFLEFTPVTLQNIQITKDEYLQIKELKEGLTLIKSPKGTGKTTYLSDVLGKIIHNYATLEEYEEDTDFETEKAFFSEERILLIGHRQALIGDLCKRLSLNSYLDDPKGDDGETTRRKQRYGVCLDSLAKVKDQKYNIIVIDEVEQVLSHFLSETIGEKRRGLFDMFSHLVQNAKKDIRIFIIV